MADLNGQRLRPEGLRGDINRLFSDQGTWLGKPALPDALRKVVTRPGPLAIVGPIRVGRGCYVGANAVLAHDLPDGVAYTVGSEVANLKARLQPLEAERGSAVTE
jgi:hypothetical protein